MKKVRSSYEKANLDYGHIFQLLIALNKPKVIVEFGILEGYSLMNMALAGKSLAKAPDITSYDIFDRFNGNHAEPEIKDKFKEFPNVSIKEGDFYQVYKEIPDYSIDLLHIDIANDGDVYKFAVEKYLSKLSPKGIMILEGGSEERDQVEWMNLYEKPKIREILRESLLYNFDYITMNVFPSITIIRPLKQTQK